MKNSYASFAIICSLIAGGLAVPLAAQQMPVFNSYLYTPEYFNPGRMGDGFVGLVYRHQWMDLDSRFAPTSYGFNADLSSVLNLSEKRIGLGVGVMADKVHLMQRYNASISFAYRLIDDSEHRLAAGVLAGILSQHFNFQDSRLFDPFDRDAFIESQRKTVFDGGPGVFYSFQAAPQHRLSVDLIAPQIFSSDLNYEQGATMDLQPHFLARFSYLYQGTAFGLEPIAVYREIFGDKKLKAGNLEFALRAHFLDERVWAGGGARLDAETFHLSLGVRPIPKLQVMAAMELNTTFGNTLEFGALYFFEEKDKPVKANLTTELRITNAALPKAQMQANETQTMLRSTGDKLANIELGRLSTTEKQAQLEEARRHLQRSYEELERLKETQSQVAAAKAAADAKVDINKAGLKNKQYKTINTNEANVSDLTAKVERSLRQTQQRFDRTSAMLPPPIGESVRKEDLVQIKTFFQERLDALAEKPRNLLPIAAEKSDRFIVLTYEFPNQVNQYDVSRHANLSDIRSLTEHIAADIRELQSQGVVVEGASISTKLRDEARIPSGIYGGEFGNTFALDYNYANTTTSQSERKTKTFSINDNIDLEQLALLKKHGMKTHLARQAGAAALQFDFFEVAAPHRSQAYTQVFSIQLRVR